MQSPFKHIAEELRREIEERLFRVGILCRVFARGKDEKSLNEKFAKHPGKYQISGKLIQDVFGIRIALYFPEDIELVKKLLCKKYTYDHPSSTIDSPDTDQFTVTRYNLIFKIPESTATDAKRIIGARAIDTCFEVQLRSILSEGWHEVEHDLRYKSKEHWEDQEDLSRALNGIFATLETSEWSMKRIFDDLAYRHYKNGKWPAMLHSKLRMRVSPTLSVELCELFSSEPELAKEVFRIDRTLVIETLSSVSPWIPINLNNIVHVWNHLHIKSDSLGKLAPEMITDALSLSNVS